MNTNFYPAVFHPEETGYSVSVPDIDGCFTQGETMDEAVRRCAQAVHAVLGDDHLARGRRGLNPRCYKKLEGQLSDSDFTRVMVCRGKRMPTPVGSKGRPWLIYPPAAQAAPDPPEACNAV